MICAGTYNDLKSPKNRSKIVKLLGKPIIKGVKFEKVRIRIFSEISHVIHSI